MLGVKIGQYLKENGIKQSFLVQKTGMSACAISDICKGERKSLDAVMFYKICKALDVDMMRFLEGED